MLRFPDEGRGALCGISLFAETGCRKGVSFGGFAKRHLDLSKTPSAHIRQFGKRPSEDDDLK